MKNGQQQVCRKCGREIAVITWGVYRKAVVDAEALMIRAEEGGEEFVRIDGSKVQGVPVGFEDGGVAEPAYRLHRKTCGRAT